MPLNWFISVGPQSSCPISHTSNRRSRMKDGGGGSLSSTDSGLTSMQDWYRSSYLWIFHFNIGVLMISYCCCALLVPSPSCRDHILEYWFLDLEECFLGHDIFYLDYIIYCLMFLGTELWCLLFLYIDVLVDHRQNNSLHCQWAASKASKMLYENRHRLKRGIEGN